MTFAPAPIPPPPPPWRGARRHGNDCGRGRGLFPGLVLIAWGGLLLLRELGVLSPTLRAGDFWPLVLVALGLSIAVRRRDAGNVLVGLAVALLGAALLARRMGYLAGVAHLWPILLIVAGIGFLWGGLGRPRVHRRSSEQVSGDDLQRSVTMGNLSLAVDSQQFRGGALSATMGEIRVDLRRAGMAAEEAVLEVSLTMGGVELYVPTHWQIVNDVSPFMGAVEDRTDPRPDANGVQRRLVLRGTITMGAVTIKN